MQEHRHLPDSNQLSVLAATILLAYALTPFIQFPESTFTLRLPGGVFPFRFTFTSVVSVLVAVLAAVGTDWLLRTHPHLNNHPTIQHWLIPALTAWTIGIPLSSIKLGLEWWAVFALGGLLLVLVFIAEYIVVDFSDFRYVPATLGLTAVSFALLLVLILAMHGSAFRLYLLLPPLGVAVGLVCLRTLYLRLGGRWCWAWSIGIALFTGQVALGLHYWRITSVAFGLLLVGLAYSLTVLAGALEEDHSWQTVWIEPAILMTVFGGLAWIIR